MSAKDVQKDEKVTPKTSVTLKFGYQQKGDETEENKTHILVEFGKRPTAREFLKSAEEADGSDTFYQLALRAATITRFGDLPIPVPMSVLLSLNQIDRATLDAGFNDFMAATAKEKQETSGAPESGTAHLMFGLEGGGRLFEIVQFGNFLTGYQELEIEKEAGSDSGIERLLLRIAKQIKGGVDDGKVFEGNFTAESVGKMDASDFLVLREAEDAWLNSFR